MRKLIFASSVSLALFSPLVFAGGYDYQKEDLSGYNLQPSSSSSDQNDYSRTGHELYFFGGYVYAKRFLSNSAKTVHNLTGTVITYVPSQAVPGGFSGLQIGMGHALSTHFDLQASYIQNFQAKKTSVYNGANYLYKVKSNNLLGDVAYIFNPDDQFQVSLQVGAMLTQTTNTISVNNAPYYTVSDSTKIDPGVGLECLMKFSQNLGVRMSALYVAETQGTNSNGEVNGILSLSYTV